MTRAGATVAVHARRGRAQPGLSLWTASAARGWADGGVWRGTVGNVARGGLKCANANPFMVAGYRRRIVMVKGRYAVE